ncbi:MAG: SpoIIE family protein phosphatase [Vicingaceae bacterium]
MSDEKTQRAKSKLQLSNSKLNRLLNLTNAINNNSTRKSLFAVLQEVLIDDLHIGKFILFTFENSWRVALTEGISAIDAKKVDIKYIIENYKSIDVLNSDQQSSLEQFDVVIPVFQKEKPLAYLLLADFEDEKIEISPIIKHLRFIQTLANIIVVALENKRLNSEYIKQIAIKKELELAQNMQSLLFPRVLPNTSELSVEAYYLPHSEVGGDYYDVIRLEGGNIALCMADVSGKGMPAALLMANFQANLRALLNVTQDISELVRQCNKKVIESADYEKFITLFVAIFNPKNKSLTYLNAGHQPGIISQNGSLKLLKKGCTVLGMFDELPKIEAETIPLTNNSRLICFTDGLAELEDKNGRQIEIEGLINLVQNEDSIQAITSSFKKTIKDLESNSGLKDDITFLAAEFFAEASTSNLSR